MSYPINWERKRIVTTEEIERLEKAGYKVTILSDGDIMLTPKEGEGKLT